MDDVDKAVDMGDIGEVVDMDDIGEVVDNDDIGEAELTDDDCVERSWCNRDTEIYPCVCVWLVAVTVRSDFKQKIFSLPQWTDREKD